MRVMRFALIVVASLFETYVFAQQVNGIIVNEQRKPIKEATIRLENTSITTVTDASGHFIVDCGNQGDKQKVLKVTYTGYMPLTVNIGKGHDVFKLDTLIMKTDTYSLAEVTVTSSVSTPIDRTIYYPSATIKKSSWDGYEFINKMSLPGVVVNMKNKTIETVDREAVLVFINDKESTKTDVMSLQPEDIVRVEFIDNPGVEYSRPGTVAGCVIKLYVRRRDSGIAAAINTSNSFTTRNGQNFGYLKYYHKASMFSLSVNSEYSSVHRRNTNEENLYKLENDWYSIQREGINTKLGFTRNNIDITYNLTKPKKYIFDVNVSGILYDSPDRGNKQKVTESGSTPYYSYNKTTEHYFSPVVNLFYKLYIGSHQSVTSNAVFTTIDTDYGYYLKEYTDDALVHEEKSYGYNTKGMKRSLILESRYANKWKSIVMSTGVRYMYGDTENKYEGGHVTTNNLYTNFVNMYMQLSGNVGRFGYYASIGASYQNTRQGNQIIDNWVVRPMIQLQAPIKKLKLKYLFSISPRTASLGSLSDVIQQANAFEYSKGNSNLKMYSVYTNRLTESISLGKWYLQNRTSFLYCAHPIMSEVNVQEINGKKAFVRTYDNQKAYIDLSDNIALSYTVIKNRLVFQGNLTYHHYQTRGNSYTHILNTIGGMVKADLYLKKWNAGISWNSKNKSLFSETINSSSAYSNIYVDYTIGKFRIGVLAFYLFQNNGIKETENLISQDMKKSLCLNIPSFGNMLMLNVSWNLQKGKRHRTEENSFSNSDTDSGVVKM